MSVEERDEILGYLRGIRSLIKWMGGASLVAVAGFISIDISDHYDQIMLRKEMDWVRPRVESMWFQHHQPSENLPGEQNITKNP